MNLEEGMYVRTKKGEISKIKWITFQRWEGINTVEAIFNLENGDILMYPNDKFKTSYNIIDLIEVGDYVNGTEVEEINDKEIMLVDNHLWIDKNVANGLIQEILTKEQYENNCYKVDDK